MSGTRLPPGGLVPGMILRLHAEGELPATAWELRRGGEVVASGGLEDAGPGGGDSPQ